MAGLLGNNWLYLLDMAKKNVLQPGATIIPAAATLYCMGIEARTWDACGFDISAFNKYRCPDPCSRLSTPQPCFAHCFRLLLFMLLMK